MIKRGRHHRSIPRITYYSFIGGIVLIGMFSVVSGTHILRKQSVPKCVSNHYSCVCRNAGFVSPVAGCNLYPSLWRKRYGEFTVLNGQGNSAN
jgi:hypothetical protein